MKRLFDVVITIQLIIFLFPLIIVISFSLAFIQGLPILFCQKRSGLLGRPFKMYKFRTMKDQKNNNEVLLSDEERLTNFGRFLRSTSLDELPELLNVLNGEMSLVGPRPLLTQYLDRYTFEQARRHEVKPGVTGWAQVNGRNAITWEEKFKLDVWYVDHISFRLDMKILFMTIWKTLKRSDITESGHATVSEFMGSKTESAK